VELRLEDRMSVAEKPSRAEKKIATMEEGGVIKPVELAGRTIARTFWGKAWCDRPWSSVQRLREPAARGRPTWRTGSVRPPGDRRRRVEALVSGSELYRVEIDITALGPARWKKIKKACSGGIASLVELLQGKLSAGVMATITGRTRGFPGAEGALSLSAPARTGPGCAKHVAAGCTASAPVSTSSRICSFCCGGSIIRR